MTLNKWQSALTDFHRVTGSTVGDTPGFRDADLRFDLIQEEWFELVDEFNASADGDPDAFSFPRAIKELCDVLYVTIGTAVAWGIDLDPFFMAVHESNMAKAGGPKRADGKQLKPEGWTAPDIAGILADQVDAAAERKFTQPIQPDPATAMAEYLRNLKGEDE